jgi:flagellin-like hook-associated protein FlgL
MRSRFEDANYADLEMETSRLDFLRQAALASLTRSQTNQQALIAAFLGFSGQ